MNNQLTADDLIDAEDVAEQSGADVNQVQEAARKNVIEDRASAKRKPCGGAASPVPLTRPTRKPLVAKPQKTTADALHAETDRIEADERTKQIMQKVGELNDRGNVDLALSEFREGAADIAAVRSCLQNLKPADIEKMLAVEVKPFSEIGVWRPEAEDPDVLILGGAILVRGGSTWFVSSAGTGKSTHCTQLAYSCAAKVKFSGLTPSREMRVWYFQSEDSPRRLAQDRADALAELAEQQSDADWESAASRVKYVDIKGKVGAEFLNRLHELLEMAKWANALPDVIFINPFMAFIGGPITDGAYVTPFLRGGEINHVKTYGLQAILEEYRIGAVIYHHTPKPPSEKDIKSWLTSSFPEYQGAGSADITNWGRTFFTMFRFPGHPDKVFITAGKNGGELGWPEVGGARRYYLAYSKAQGISGKGRHAWRDVDDDERTELDAAIEKLTSMKKTENKSKVEKVTDIAPYVIRALDETREATLEIGEKFQGMTQRALWQKVQSLIVADGKESFGRDKLIELLDALPPSVCEHVEGSPVYYGTKADLECHQERTK